MNPSNHVVVTGEPTTQRAQAITKLVEEGLEERGIFMAEVTLAFGQDEFVRVIDACGRLAVERKTVPIVDRVRSILAEARRLEV